MRLRSRPAKAAIRGTLTMAAAVVGMASAAPGASAQPHAGGSLVYDNISGPGTLDAYVSGSLVELEIIHHIYEGLVEMDEHYAW